MTNSGTDPRDIAHAFFEAFRRRDSFAMGRLYQDGSPDVFSDPVFVGLSTEETRAMWSMLLGRLKTWNLEYRILSAEGEQVRVEWTADYVFSATGRNVRNRVLSSMTIRDGRIVRQSDDFSLGRWCRQAFGAVAGTFVFLAADRVVRARARQALASFMRSGS